MLSKFTSTAVFAVSTLLSLALSAKAADVKIVGTMSASVVQQQVIPLEKGATKSLGSPLDGATIMLAETVVLDKGNGPQEGNITLANDKGSITNEIRGTVKTVMVDGQPRVSTSGTYKVTVGTGVFAGATGHGF